MIDAVWKMEVQRHRLDTPEDKAAFKRALKERIAHITDRTILAFYREEINTRYREEIDTRFNQEFSSRKTNTQYPNTRNLSANQLKRIVEERAISIHKNERETRIILGTLLMHPQAIPKLESLLEQVTFQPAEMTNLYHAMLAVVNEEHACDSEELKNHLIETEYRSSVEKVLDEVNFEFVPFTRPGIPLEKVLETMRILLIMPCMEQLQEQEQLLIKAYFDDPCTANRDRLKAIQHERKRSHIFDVRTFSDKLSNN